MRKRGRTDGLEWREKITKKRENKCYLKKLIIIKQLDCWRLRSERAWRSVIILLKDKK